MITTAISVGPAMTSRAGLTRAVQAAGLVGLTVASAGLCPNAEAASVTLNGQPLATTAAPIVRHGRTLVPMRDIFQALGATVVWYGPTRSIVGRRGATSIGLQINNRSASINDRQVRLDQAAILYHGSTMVPIRFVAESLGAQVGWNTATQIAS